MPPAATKKVATFATKGKATVQTASASSSTPRLPRPLRAHLLSLLDPLNPLDFRTIARLSRTSKEDRALARPLLYSTVVVYDPRESIFRSLAALVRGFASFGLGGSAPNPNDEEDDFPDDLDDDQERDAALDRPTKRLLAACEADPEVAKLPTTLVYYGKIETWGASLAVEKILAVCPNISKVRLVAMEPGMFDESGRNYDDEEFQMLDVLVKEQARLQSLEVRRMLPDRSFDFFRAVPKLNNLKHLSFSVMRGEDFDLSVQSYNLPPPPAHQLSSLDCGSVVEPSLFKYLTSSSHSSLARLTIAIRRQPLDLSRLTSLKHLAVEYNRNEVLRYSLAIDRLDGKYARWNSEYEDDDEEEDEDEEEDRRGAKRRTKAATKEAKENAFSTLLAGLPSSLTRLHISSDLEDGAGAAGEPTEFDALLAALEKRKAAWLPHLVQLDVHDPSTADDGFSDPPTEGQKRHFAEQRERVRRACEKRGVWLGPRVEAWWQASIDEGKIPRAF
ncbi:hypothetical protein JCM8097_004763 [Rhodosporidiobolus ruineniae]